MSVLNCGGSIDLKWNVAETIALGFGSVVLNDDVEPSFSWTPGTSSSQIDLHWEKQGVVITPGTTISYTLSALVDTQGRTINIHTLTGMLIAVTTRVAGDRLALGNPETGGFFPAPVADAAGSMFGGTSGGLYVYDLFAYAAEQTDGLSISAGSADVIPVKNVGTNSITYNIAFMGRSV